MIFGFCYFHRELFRNVPCLVIELEQGPCVVLLNLSTEHCFDPLLSLIIYVEILPLGTPRSSIVASCG